MKRNEIKRKLEFLIEDMGKSTFRELLNFVVEVMRDEHDVKIFMARRFLDIFLGFEEMVQYLYNGKVEKRGTFVTNLSVSTLRNELSDKTIMVVDDIRLHGKALDEITTFLIEECHCLEESIVLKIFVDNRDVVKIKSKYQPKLEIRKTVDRDRWKKISSSIINSLYILGQPYVSHLPYFEVKSRKKAANIIKKFTKREEVEEITTDVQKYYGVRSYLYLEENDLDRMLFVEQNMIRIYIFEKLGKIIVVPYAYLKPLSAEGILYYYKQLSSKKVIRETFDRQNTETAVLKEGDVLRYLYSLEIYATSLALGEQFIIDRRLKGISWERKIEKYCFRNQFDINSAGFDSIILDLEEEERRKCGDYTGSELQLDKPPEIIEIINSISQENTENFSVNNMLESYIKLSGKYDEQLAQQNKKRMHGMEYRRLRKWLMKAETRELWKSIINIVDSGRGALTISLNEVDRRHFADSLLFAGELHDSCNECNLIYFVYPLLEYECRCKNTINSKDKDTNDIHEGKDKLIDFISQVYPELREEITDSEIEYLRNTSILDEGLDYYTSMYAVYEHDDKLRQVLDATRFRKE